MDAFQTPGAFSWCELMTTDPTAASAFYAGLFGWKMETMTMGMPYHVVKVGDGDCTIQVESNPIGAVVLYRGRAVAQTPADINGLACGKPARVTLSHAKFEPLERTVTPVDVSVMSAWLNPAAAKAASLNKTFGMPCAEEASNVAE